MAVTSRRSTTFDATAIAQTVGSALGIDSNNQGNLGHRRSILTGRSSFVTGRSSIVGGSLANFNRRSSIGDLGATFDTLSSQINGDSNVNQDSHLRGTRRGSTLGNTAMARRSVIDAAAEHALSGSYEDTPCYKPCVETDLGLFYCAPADHAIRHKRKVATDDDDDHLVQAGNTAMRSFGLRPWNASGYRLCERNEVELPDPSVYTKLGFKVAIHRQTSVVRYVDCVSKSRLPENLPSATMKTLVKALLKLDHIFVLRCHEVYEDDTSIYFLYEFWPCTLVDTVLDTAEWTQDQIVSIVSNCCAAMSFAHAASLTHLGLSLSHVLLPPQPSSGAAKDIYPAKIFGFGLAGVTLQEAGERFFWAPESAEKYLQFGGNHVTKIESANKVMCDRWSLGAIAYSLVARQPPITGTPEGIIPKMIEGKWRFSPAFDDMDMEAKAMMEACLDRKKDKRMKADEALQHEWIRRRRKPAKSDVLGKAFDALYNFASMPKAKRLFGRFLVRFLGPEVRLELCRRFKTLDINGDGLLDYTDLETCAKQSSDKSISYSKSSAKHAVLSILEKYGGHHAPISLSQFAESVAETLINGSALRHAFESLDDDGSEEITAQELFDNLSLLDESLTMEEVVKHIAEAEGGLADEEGATEDHCIDFGEFMLLFPERMRRMAEHKERTEASHSYASKVQSCLDTVDHSISLWESDLNHSIDECADLAGKVQDRKFNGAQIVKDLTKVIRKMNETLRQPPGSDQFVVERVMRDWTELQKKKSRGKMVKENEYQLKKLLESYSFDTFVKIQAVHEEWGSMLVEDLKNLKDAAKVGAHMGKTDEVDRYKAYDAAECILMKTKDISKWVQDQHEEYKSLTDAMMSLEPSLPSVSLSARGLRRTAEDDEKDRQADAAAAAGGDEEGNVQGQSKALCTCLAPLKSIQVYPSAGWKDTS